MKRTCALTVSAVSLMAVLWLWSHCIDTRAMPDVNSPSPRITHPIATKEITHTTTRDFQAGIADNVNISSDNGGEIATAFLGGPFVPGTGALSWTRLADLPYQASYHTSFVTKGYLFVLDDSGVSSTPVGDDGTIGTWTSLPALPPKCGISPCTAAVSNDHVFLVGGNRVAVHSAPLLEDGRIGPWSALNPLPAPVWGSQTAVVVKGHLIVIGGSYVAVVSYSAPINADGSIGSWSATSRLPTTLGKHAVVANGDYIYVIGGTPAGGTSVKTVYVTSVDDEGMLGAWSTTTPFNAVPTCCVTGLKGHSAFASNGYLFVAGGRLQTDRDNYISQIYAAAINPDGTLGAWSIPAIAGLAGGFGQGHSLAKYNDYLFQSGGCTTDTSCSNRQVFSAQIPTLDQRLPEGTFTHRFYLGGNDSVKALRWTAIGPSSTTSMTYRIATASSAVYGGWSTPTTTNPLPINRTASYVEYRLQFHNPPGESITVTDISLVVSPDFALVVSPTNRIPYQTELVTYSVELSPTAMFSQPVSLQIQGVPAGTTVAITPDTISPGQRATLEVATSLMTPTEAHALTAIGTSLALTRTSAFTLTVLPAAIDLAASPPDQTVYQNQTAIYTLSLEATPGFTYPATLSAGALPGIDITFHPEETSPGQSAVMELHTSLAAPTGTQTVTVTAETALRRDTEQIEVTVLPAAIDLTASPLAQTVYQNQTATYTLSLEATPGFTYPANLSAEALPPMDIEFLPEEISPGQSALMELHSSLATPTGTQTVTVTAETTFRRDSEQIELTVLPAAFNLAAAPSYQMIYQGQSATYAVTYSTTPGTLLPFSLTVESPEGVGATLTDKVIYPGGSSSVMITTRLSTPIGLHTVTVIGLGEWLSETSSISVTRAVQATCDISAAAFTLVATPAVHTTFPGTTAIFSIDIPFATPGFPEPIDLTVSDLPDSITRTISPPSLLPGSTATLTLGLPATMPLGAYPFRIIGAVAGISSTAEIRLNVRTQVFLPVVLRRWPPIPGPSLLNPIENIDGGGFYVVTWPATELAQTYFLEESADSEFSGSATVYQGANRSWSVPGPGKAAGTYYYRVRGHNLWGFGPYSNVQSVAVLPPAVPTLYAIDNSDGNGAYSVTWSSSARATWYTLQEDRGSSFASPTTVYEGGNLSWSATNQVPGTYYYRVISHGPTGVSAWSNTRSVIVPTPPPGVSILPNHYAVEGESGEVHIFGEVRNSHASTVSAVRVAAVLYNGQGQIIDTDSSYVWLDHVPAGEKTCFHVMFWFPPPGWASYEFEAPTYYVGGDSLPNLSIFNINTYYDPVFGDYSILGQVRNDHGSPVDNVYVVGTLYNGTGTVIGCSEAYLISSDLAPGQVSAFELEYWARDYPDVATYRLQADGDPQ